jgi:hypothetical protein
LCLHLALFITDAVGEVLGGCCLIRDTCTTKRTGEGQEGAISAGIGDGYMLLSLFCQHLSFATGNRLVNPVFSLTSSLEKEGCSCSFSLVFR